MHMSVRAAMENHAGAAQDSMMKEVINICSKVVFESVQVRALAKVQRRSIIRSSMFMKDKYLSTGEFQKLKSRFVAVENMQDRSIYDEGVMTSVRADGRGRWTSVEPI